MEVTTKHKADTPAEVSSDIPAQKKSATITISSDNTADDSATPNKGEYFKPPSYIFSGRAVAMAYLDELHGVVRDVFNALQTLAEEEANEFEDGEAELVEKTNQSIQDCFRACMNKFDHGDPLFKAPPSEPFLEEFDALHRKILGVFDHFDCVQKQIKELDQDCEHAIVLSGDCEKFHDLMLAGKHITNKRTRELLDVADAQQAHEELPENNPLRKNLWDEFHTLKNGQTWGGMVRKSEKGISQLVAPLPEEQ